MKRSKQIELLLKTLPHSPGIYQYFDKEGNILYVGKAKNIKKRVSSYFNKIHDSGKTKILVSKIADIKTLVVETEFDALLLENNLIKKYQPKYNIMLKDDKTYPWICIKKERFPRVFSTRRVIKDGSEYFGPYASVKVMYTLLDMIKELYPLRTCNYKLSEENIAAGKFKVCLEYHLGNCLGPCEGYQTEEEYNEIVKAVRNILKGNFNEAKEYMNTLMLDYAQKLKFEAAQKVKERIEILQNYQARSTVVNPKINNVDVFTVLSDSEYAYVNFLKINNGAIIQGHTFEYKKKLEELDLDILQNAIVEIREKFNSLSREIYVPFSIELEIPNVKIMVPQIGDKRKLIDLSLRNAKYFRQERFKQSNIIDPDRHVNRIMSQMKKDLRMPVEPRYIECFDNSNIQGTNPVAACVVFRNGKPFKKDYRHYKIKTVEGPDDFASMEEVVYRRYKRLLEEEKPLPDLIVIDGGKGQLSSALKSLDKLEIRGKVTILGIAKRLEELFFPDDPIPLYLDKNSETLKVIQNARNEAHRFGITFHRNLRSKGAVHSELENIKGIGEKAIVQLLKKFKSVKRVKEASKKELVEVLGVHKGGLVYQYFNS
ncbi:uvrABC system protein [Flavobacteriaceae bacterium UJ101]|nr:uvrABC system protein [Flavobacteriaceae bacterium UJ101]